MKIYIETTKEGLRALEDLLRFSPSDNLAFMRCEIGNLSELAIKQFQVKSHLKLFTDLPKFDDPGWSASKT